MDKHYYLFIGTYSPADNDAIFIYRFNAATGESSFVSAVSGIENPSFLTLAPNRRFLYAVSETHGGQGGRVYAYAFDSNTGRLSYINHQPTHGDDPCNIITDETGKWLFVSNYTSGSFSIFPLEEDGAVGGAVQTIRHKGHGIEPQQDGPHVHCVMPAPGNRDIFVTDLGLDKVFTYEFNAETGRVDAGDPPYTEVIPGSGPRHITFSPGGKHLYLIHELGGQLTVFAYDPGRLTPVQTLSDIPEGFHGKIWAADIHFSPDGKFLYASDRDDLNDLVIYAADAVTGELTHTGRIVTGGKTPRNFTIVPDGSYLLVGHQHDDKITVFKRDPQDGKLTKAKEHIGIPHAVCLKMIPL